ncbi:MAG: hypothetical protein RRX93_01800 [Bacteroidales bacterium]
MKKFTFLLLLLVLGIDCEKSLAQQAYRLSKFTTEEDLKAEVSFRIGPSIAVGKFKNVNAFSDQIAQGAKMGGLVDIAYNYYFTPRFGIGFAVGGQWFAYSFSDVNKETSSSFSPSPTTSKNSTKIKKSAWEMYSLGLVLNARIPLLRKLYFTGRIELAYAILLSPKMEMIYKNDKRQVYNRETLMRGSTTNHFLLAGGVGLQYRFVKNILGQINFDYMFFPTTSFGSDQVGTKINKEGLRLQYSAFAISLGVSYAF